MRNVVCILVAAAMLTAFSAKVSWAQNVPAATSLTPLHPLSFEEDNS